MMTKQDFQAIAGTLNDMLWDESADPATILRLAGRLSVVCKQSNPRFDKDRFIEACVADRKERKR